GCGTGRRRLRLPRLEVLSRPSACQTHEWAAPVTTSKRRSTRRPAALRSTITRFVGRTAPGSTTTDTQPLLCMRAVSPVRDVELSQPVTVYVTATLSSA